MTKQQLVKTLRTGLMLRMLSSVDAMDTNAPTNSVWKYVLRPCEREQRGGRLCERGIRRLIGTPLTFALIHSCGRRRACPNWRARKRGDICVKATKNKTSSELLLSKQSLNASRISETNTYYRTALSVQDHSYPVRGCHSRTTSGRREHTYPPTSLVVAVHVHARRAASATRREGGRQKRT